MVAGRGVHRPPYGAVRALIQWARAHAGYIDGRLALAGGDLGADLRSLAFPRWLNLVYVTLVDTIAQQQPKEGALVVVEGWLRDEAALRSPVRDDLDSTAWGADPDSVAAAAAWGDGEDD